MKESIVEPTLLVNKALVISHIKMMKAKADATGAIFRPHFKTHQSATVGEWFRELGVDKITVSSVTMARYFAANGWKDITIAFPVNLREMNEINELSKSVQLNLLFESTRVVNMLDAAIQSNVGVFIKIDTGYKRTGIAVEKETEILELARLIQSKRNLNLIGLLVHAGHTYKAKGIDEIAEITSSAATKLKFLKHIIGDNNLIISWGDTPSCSLVTDLNDFDELRPGNFVFYDVMQYHIGSCALSDIAVAMACPIVAIHPERNQLVIYGGAVHFSKERILADNGFELFGYVVRFTDNGWSDPLPGAWLASLSQEHGIVQLTAEQCATFKVGDLIGILPIHSCLSVSAMQQMQSLDDEVISCLSMR